MLPFFLIAPAFASDSVLQWERQVGDTVGGRAVGYAGTPTGFYTAAQEAMSTASTSDAMRLVDSPQPAARVLGLMLLAREGTAHLDAITAHACDDATVTYAPGGCTVWTETVGDLVLDLLVSPDLVGITEAIEEPLMSAESGEALALALLAGDACTRQRERLARRVQSETLAGWDVVAVRSGLDPVQQTRAVGRLIGAHPDVALSLLTARLSDPRQPAEVRLSAASALPHVPGDDARQALLAHRNTLDAYGGWGSRLLAEHDAHRAFLKSISIFDDIRTWRENKRRWEEAVSAMSLAPAVALPTLRRHATVSYGSRDAEIHAVYEERLRVFIGQVEEGMPAWHVDSDLAEHLSLLARTSSRSLSDEMAAQLRVLVP